MSEIDACAVDEIDEEQAVELLPHCRGSSSGRLRLFNRVPV